MSDLPILSSTIFIPLFGAFWMMIFAKRNILYIPIIITLLTLLSTAYILFNFDNSTHFQFIEYYDSNPYIGVDGISVYFIFLTALLSLICISGAFFVMSSRFREFSICFLLLESFCIGAFCSMNLLLFYIFFEAILIPIYLIIGIWGGKNSVYATFKFFLYTLFGSVFFLISIIYIHTQTDTFNILTLQEILPKLPINIQIALWLGTFLALAIKIPMLPFHSWLPDAHLEAPTTGSVMLAAILIKIGAYGMLRISLPMFPMASLYFSKYILYLSSFTIIYASLVALKQTDIKKMIAYSSIAHMGYVTGGIFSFNANGISGAIFQMISHGIVSAALFMIIGMLYERTNTRDIKSYGGLATSMPILSCIFMIIIFSSIGLPGTSGFIGELYSMIGIFSFNKIAGIISAFGIVISATYMLSLYKAVMLGKNNMLLDDLSLWEKLSLLPLILLTIYWGIVPSHLLSAISIPVQNLSLIYKII